MAKDFNEIFREAANLPEHDRAALAGLLIESLEGDADSDVEAAWAAEIQKRIAEVESGAIKTVPWEDVQKRLLARLNAR